MTFCNKYLPGTILIYLGLHCAEEPAKTQAPLPSGTGIENLDDLIQMSADLELAGQPLPGPAALGGGPDAAWRPRHTSSSSDISSEGKTVTSEGRTIKYPTNRSTFLCIVSDTYSFERRICIQHFRLNTDPNPGF
jgi:hypothetical protein